DDDDRRGSIAQEASEQEHQERVNHERADPDPNPSTISALESRAQAEEYTQHPDPRSFTDGGADTGNSVERNEAVGEKPPSKETKQPKAMAIRCVASWRASSRGTGQINAGDEAK